MAKTTVEIQGLRQLGEKLRELSADIANKVSHQATAAGASLIRKEVRKRAPKDTGNLARNIIIKKLPRGEAKANSEYIVTVRKGRTKAQKKQNAREAYYAMFHEFGTVKMPARPFIRPAFENKKMAAVSAMTKKLKDRIDKANRTIP